MSYRNQVEIWAKEYDVNLTATDPRFLNVVNIHSTCCMTNVIYDNAFTVKKQEFYIVFTEHNGFHIFHEEEYQIMMYQKIDIEELI